MSYLNPGLAVPVAAPDGLDAPYWEAAARDVLMLQFCNDCGTYQWGPEWVCHRCHSEGPYLIVLVEFPNYDGARMVGNLLGDPEQEVVIGAEVEAVFEHHPDSEPPHTLVQWQLAD